MPPMRKPTAISTNSGSTRERIKLFDQRKTQSDVPIAKQASAISINKNVTQISQPVDDDDDDDEFFSNEEDAKEIERMMTPLEQNLHTTNALQPKASQPANKLPRRKKPDPKKKYKCDCGEPAKENLCKNGKTENLGKYYFTCASRKCSYWKWVESKEDTKKRTRERMRHKREIALGRLEMKIERDRAFNERMWWYKKRSY